MKISIYELLELIKEGKAPKKIEYKESKYEFNEEVQCYENELEFFPSIQEINLNDEVEIIEEDKEIEKIKVTKEDNCKRFIEYDDKTGHHKYTIRVLDEYFANKINELIDEIKELKENN